MSNHTPSLIEQLADDLRQSFIQVVYWRNHRRELAVFRDFVGNCQFVGLVGLARPELVIRQYPESGKDDLVILLEDVKEIEVLRDSLDGVEHNTMPHAWWYVTPFFGRGLERHAVPEV